MQIFLPYLQIVFSSFCVYVFIIFSLRIFGKRDLTQLSVLDVVFILLISNAVQNAMVGSNTSLSGGLVAALTLFVTNSVFKILLNKSQKLNELIQGHPIMLIYSGKLVQENMKKTGITIAELEETIREHGVAKIEDVNLAILETDGNISVLSEDYAKRTNKKSKIKRTIYKQD